MQFSKCIKYGYYPDLEEAELGQPIVDEIESQGLAINQWAGGKHAREENSPRLAAGLAASISGRLLRKLLWSWDKDKGSATLPWAVGGRIHPGFPLDHLPTESRQEIRGRNDRKMKGERWKPGVGDNMVLFGQREETLNETRGWCFQIGLKDLN